MAIECYHGLCPHHENNHPGGEGPFCHKDECIALRCTECRAVLEEAYSDPDTQCPYCGAVGSRGGAHGSVA